MNRFFCIIVISNTVVVKYLSRLNGITLYLLLINCGLVSDNSGVLSPILFSVYVNDIPVNLQQYIVLAVMSMASLSVH